MGLDVRALLLGAAAMTKRFLEERFETNPVLQYAAVNYLMTTQHQKPIRVLSIWSKKLEALGLWYDQLLAESLGKQGLGPTPLTAVQTRDLHSRGQQHQEGTRDKVINNLVVKAWTHPPIMVGMADRNEDELNQYNRKGLPDMMNAALRGHQPGILRRGPADRRPGAADDLRAHDGPAHADADAGDRGRRPAAGRQPLRPAGRRTYKAAKRNQRKRPALHHISESLSVRWRNRQTADAGRRWYCFLPILSNPRDNIPSPRFRTPWRGRK